MASPQRVDAPPATPPLYGLVIAAPAIDNTDLDVWGSGWTFNPEGCGDSGRVALNCGGGTNGSRTPGTNPPNVEGAAFLVWAAQQCTSKGFRAGNYEARAQRQLAATESFQIAQELWTGTLSTAQGLPNRPLIDSSSDTITGTPEDPLTALALLVSALGTCGQGRVGMIHVTPQVLVHLQDSSAVYRDGNIWRTPMGHRVVADDGYDGSGPGGVPATATQWAYATSTIRVRRGPVETTPFEQAAAAGYETNTVRVYANRMAGYEWDECCHLAAEIAVPRPLIGPPS